MKPLAIILLCTAPLLTAWSLWQFSNQLHAYEELEKEIIFLSGKIASSNRESKRESSLKAQLEQTDPHYISSYLSSFLRTASQTVGKWREVDLKQREPQLMDAEGLQRTLTLIEGIPADLHPGRPPLFIKEFHLTKSEKEEKYLVQMHLVQRERCE